MWVDGESSCVWNSPAESVDMTWLEKPEGLSAPCHDGEWHGSKEGGREQ